MKKDPDGRLSVLCDDSGVRFIETYVSQPMPDHGPHHTAKKGINRYLSQINPLQVVDGDTPLFTVKLTHMKGGGSVLGVTMNHAVADGSAYMRFMESWSKEHRGLGYPTPGHDRGIIDALAAPVADDARPDNDHFTVTKRGRKSAYVARILLSAVAKVTTMVTTRFTAAELAAMKDAAMADLAGTERWVSTNDALTAHLWKVLGALRDRPDASEEKLGLLADFRAFGGGAVPDGYWGNTVTNTRPGMTAAELRSRPVGEVATAVRAGYAENTEEKIRQETAFLRAEYEAGRLKRVLPTMTLDKSENTIVINKLVETPLLRPRLRSGHALLVRRPGASHSLDRTHSADSGGRARWPRCAYGSAPHIGPDPSGTVLDRPVPLLRGFRRGIRADCRIAQSRRVTKPKAEETESRGKRKTLGRGGRTPPRPGWAPPCPACPPALSGSHRSRSGPRAPERSVHVVSWRVRECQRQTSARPWQRAAHPRRRR
ncbi:Transferase [Streptomyces violaceusniger Tu 4113]|uniref:Transferase n=2 Tax=Streptomyces violaceusniger TaxID=68280 RepID=G2P6X8_STRV4|nr:Transferase [Streptomyces violaceusniger Tu 4113]